MDFGSPITPGDVCRYSAERLKWLADEHRRKAAEHIAIAGELDDFRHRTEQDAAQFDRWQPAPVAEPADG